MDTGVLAFDQLIINYCGAQHAYLFLVEEHVQRGAVD